MKAKLLERRKPFDKSFSSAIHNYPHFLNIWHYHPQLELVLMVKSTGTRFVGDSIQSFAEGELVLLGENLPHMWQNDKQYFEKESVLTAESITLHFKKDFAGEGLLDIPEMIKIKSLFDRASQGIVFEGNILESAHEKLLAIHHAEGFSRWILFMNFLEELAEETDFRFLSSKGFIHPKEKNGDSRIDKVYSFTFNNFHRNITLDEVADIANLNPTAFCRFFKKNTKKNYSKFLNEIRIGYACRMLLEENMNVSQIGYESGFNNLSNFNRQFKSSMGLSPTDYLSKYQKRIKVLL
jgi:AraC-like DNA-binding protein